MATSEPHGDHALPPSGPAASEPSGPQTAAPASQAVPGPQAPSDAPGSHRIPARIPGPRIARARRRPPRGLVFGLLGAAVAGLVLGGLQLGAHLTYDAAEEGLEDAARLTAHAQDDARDAAGELKAATEEAGRMVGNDSGLLADPALKGALSDAIADGEGVDADAATVIGRSLPVAGGKPGWFWELFGASERLQELREQTEDHRDALEEEIPELAAATGETSEAGIAVLTSASSAATPFEAAHVSAKNLDVIALREAAVRAADTATFDASAVDAFIILDDAAERVVTSEQEELAEKAGPLQGARLEIEAFARSLAPGVLMEFDWSPLVNGYGGGGSMGGYTTWWYDDPGYAALELSNSVAEQWPAERSRALVAHEVGHAISVKCHGMYDDSTADSIEKWATAWAISMGFTDDANGVWAYGYPPQSYIDAAAGCR